MARASAAAAVPGPSARPRRSSRRHVPAERWRPEVARPADSMNALIAASRTGRDSTASVATRCSVRLASRSRQQPHRLDEVAARIRRRRLVQRRLQGGQHHPAVRTRPQREHTLCVHPWHPAAGHRAGERANQLGRGRTRRHGPDGMRLESGRAMQDEGHQLDIASGPGHAPECMDGREGGDGVAVVVDGLEDRRQHCRVGSLGPAPWPSSHPAQQERCAARRGSWARAGRDRGPTRPAEPVSRGSSTTRSRASPGVRRSCGRAARSSRDLGAPASQAAAPSTSSVALRMATSTARSEIAGEAVLQPRQGSWHGEQQRSHIHRGRLVHEVDRVGA